MRVLVACEYSGRVRDAFLALGHDAMSCDLLPTDMEGPHHMGDEYACRRTWAHPGFADFWAGAPSGSVAAPSVSDIDWIGPLYGTGAGSNDGDYSNPDFDALLSDAAAAATPEEGTALLQDAQEILLEDLPAVPLWYSNVTGGYAEVAQNVEFGWNSVPLYYEISK